MDQREYTEEIPKPIGGLGCRRPVSPTCRLHLHSRSEAPMMWWSSESPSPSWSPRPTSSAAGRPGARRSCWSVTEPAAATTRRIRASADTSGPGRVPGPRWHSRLRRRHDMSHGWMHRLRSSSVGLAFLAGLLVAGLLHLPHFSVRPAAERARGRPPAKTAPPAGAATLADLSEAFASVAEHVKPSVVFIKSGQARSVSPQIRSSRCRPDSSSSSLACRSRAPISRRAPARASSSRRTATSSPTITSSTAPTR